MATNFGTFFKGDIVYKIFLKTNLKFQRNWFFVDTVDFRVWNVKTKELFQRAQELVAHGRIQKCYSKEQA